MMETAQIWWRRAEQADRLALTLAPQDAAILAVYAQECAARAQSMSCTGSESARAMACMALG